MKKAANENFKTTAVFNDENEFCVIVFYWEDDRFLFLEHIAVERALRGRGYASDALRILKNKNKPVILEIEPPVDEKTEKRYSFYRKNGFSIIGFDLYSYSNNDPERHEVRIEMGKKLREPSR